MRTKKEKVEIPQEWNFYLEVYNQKDFQNLLSDIDKINLEEIFERFKKMYLLFVKKDVKFKTKVKIDYHNSWRIKQIMGFFINYKKEIDSTTADKDYQAVKARLFWLQLQIFLRDYII